MVMEFIEAALFTQIVTDYLDDEEYWRLEAFLAENPEAGGLCRRQEAFASYDGEIHDARKVSGAGYALSTITFPPMPKSGLPFCMTKHNLTTSHQWRRKPYGKRLRQKR